MFGNCRLRDREPIVLRYYDNLSYEQIAEVLGISLQAVHGRLIQGKKKGSKAIETCWRNRGGLWRLKTITGWMMPLPRQSAAKNAEPNFAKWQQEHPQAVQMLKSQTTRQSHPRCLLDIGKIIMRSPIAKLAVAATIIVAVVISISVFNKSIPAAFGIEQVIAAYGNVHFLYLKYSWPNQQIESEFWIKSDEQGNVAKVRGNLRETGDGPKLFVWTPEKEEIWFKRSNTLSISGPSKAISPWQTILDRSQPKLLMKKLIEDQNEGKVDVDIQKPQEMRSPLERTESREPNLRRARRRRRLFPRKSNPAKKAVFLN